MDCNSETYPKLFVIAPKTSYTLPVSDATTGGLGFCEGAWWITPRSSLRRHTNHLESETRRRPEADQGSPSAVQCLMKLDG